MSLERLKTLIDEENYPFYEDSYLVLRLAMPDVTTESLARELCIEKAGIPEVKLGDVIVPSPREYFLVKAARLRVNRTGTVVRADGQ